MYLDALSFLDDERDAWRPFEALAALDDEQLARPVAAAHGWSGRDLIGHLLAWLEVALAVARELAVDPSSPTMERSDREWDELGGEVVNERLLAAWRALPMAEVRRHLRRPSVADICSSRTPGEVECVRFAGQPTSPMIASRSATWSA